MTYRYLDKNGAIHFTDCKECIPNEYKDQKKTIQEEPLKRKASSEEVVKADKGKQEKGKESVTIQEKAALEKEKQDKGLKNEQEREKHIKELQTQIIEKQKEESSLRANLRIFDRYKMNQLNQMDQLNHEIGELQNQLQEIQNKPMKEE